MTSGEPGDAVERTVRALRVHDASRARSERIRDRCVAVLEARRRAEARADAHGAGWRAWLEPALALGLGALFLAEAFARVLAVYR